jgi:hydroxypyruvate reductase
MTLTSIFLEVARRVDGAALVGSALGSDPRLLPERFHLLCAGKAAFPMLRGLLGAIGAERIAGGLVVSPATRLVAPPDLPKTVVCLSSDHPDPSSRSVAAGHAACDRLEALRPSENLVVLLSGGASSALAVPANGLCLDDKRTTSRAVARAGAGITELNSVRKHLSAIKGGQLGLRARVPTVVLALSDVLGNDPSTIASGPFSPDPTSFGQALAVVERLAPTAPARAVAHLQKGAAGHTPETPKPGDPRLRHVAFRLIAGPERVVEDAQRVVLGRGLCFDVLSAGTESSVDDLALAYGRRAQREAISPTPGRVLVGNGEPSIVVRGTGHGGRATHLALAVAHEIRGLARVTFLAAGTDDRDGSTQASGAAVDGTTWARAEASGLDPAGALARFDSEPPLRALGCLVHGPGTSNLLDLHLLGIGV